MRSLLRVSVVAVAFAVGMPPAFALIMAAKPPAQRAITAEVVVAGKITAIDKEEVEAVAPYAGAKNKVRYKVATVTIETGLAEADKLKEIKVGFALPPKQAPNAKGPGGPVARPGGPLPAIDPKEGQQMLFFLAKHPSADFYVIPNMSPPVDLKDEQGKKTLESVKKALATIADPMKGLKSDRPEVRAETATLMILKYRAFPELGGETEPVAINADENKLLLSALLDGDWSTQNVRRGPLGEPTPYTAFNQLGLNDKDGWIPPIIARQPAGAPPVDYGLVMKDAFSKWLEGPGKNYVIKKQMPKK